MNDVAALNEATELLRDVDTQRRHFRPYDRYRASGNSWLGDIPDHWDVMAMKHALAMPITDGPHETPEFLSSGVPFISAEAIKNDSIDFSRKRGFISEDDHARYSRKYIPRRGDVYMVKSGATTGNVARVDTDMEFNIWSPLAVLRPHARRSTTDFIFYFMKSRPFLHSVELAWSYGTQQNIGMGVVSNLRMAIPPISEQEAIARFLDRETAKIDSLVSKKRRLIALLGEKRTALISHAVTKGLNPDATMKPSGIDWLGDVPSHWHFKKLGFLVSMRGGMTPSKGNDSYWKGSIPWVSPKDMKFREIVDSEDHISESALEETNLVLFEPPVVLMVVRGMILAHTFPVAITRVPVTVNQDMKALTPKADCSEEYLLNLLNGLSRVILGTVDDSAHGTKVLRLPVWKHVGIFMPDRYEQADICRHIQHTLHQFDGLIKKVESAIDRLNEYRSSLISAAVTGQIDVRKEVANAH